MSTGSAWVRLVAVPDAQFDNPLLAVFYDPLDPDRDDLDHYLAMLDEFAATSVVDIGCGTGRFAIAAAERGRRSIGVDPALAMLDVARAKPGSQAVTWINGTAGDAVGGFDPVDMAVMTGNVAQVFVTDEDWHATLAAIRTQLVPQGLLVFETRDPSAKAWERWTRFVRSRVTEVEGHGPVTSWVDVTEVDGELVTFDSFIGVEATGQELWSSSTLRFRPRETVSKSLVDAGFDVIDVRDAPDRPGLEFVFVARSNAA